MHIAMVTPYPADKPKGGVEAAASNLVRELSLLGDHKITVIAPSYRGENHAEERDGFTLQWVSQPPLGFLSYWSIMRRRVHKLLADLNPDITHFQAMLALSNGYKEPYLGTVHGIGEQDIRTRGGRFSELRARIVGWVESKARRSLKDCIVINPYVAEMLNGQLDEAVLHHIGNPLDAVFFEGAPRISRNNDFLFIAKMDRNKNLAAAVSAFAAAEAELPKDTRLVVYGPIADQLYHEECLTLIDRHGLVDRVEFLGSQPPATIATHMRSARALMLTSQHEVAPMVISEALSCGLPSISYRKCGMQYMIQSGLTGVLVNDGDVTGLAEAMKTVCSAQDMEERCLKAGQVYSPRQIAEETFRVYEQILRAEQAG